MNKKSSEILQICSKLHALKYFNDNLRKVFVSDIPDKAKSEVLRSVSVAELKHLYKMIYGISWTSSNSSKMAILHRINEYCRDQERVTCMAKSLGLY